MRTRAAVRMVAALLLAGLALAACGDRAAEDPTSLAAQPAGRGQTGTSQQAGTRRFVDYRAHLRIQVHDADAAADRARRTAVRAGGYLSGSHADLTGDREVRVTLRVPSARFDEVVADLSALGTVRSRTVTSDDVTDQVVDLQSRLDTARASAARLRTLLGRAEDVGQVGTVESLLTKREADIESLEGRLQVLRSRAALSTIDATFTERNEPRVAKGLPGFVDAIRAGAVTLANIGLVALVVLGFLLPFLPLLALAWWLARRWRRRHPRRPPPPAPAWPAQPPWAGAWPGDRPPPPTAPEPAEATGPDAPGGEPADPAPAPPEP